MPLLINQRKLEERVMALLLCGIAVMAFSNMPVPKTIVILLFLCGQLFMTWEYSVSALFMIVPFASILPIDEMIVIFVVVQIIKEKKLEVQAGAFLIVITFFIIELIAEMLHGAEAKSAIIFISYIIAATVICFHPSDDGERDKMTSAFIGGLLLAILATMVISFKERSLIGLLSTRLGTLPVDSVYKFTIGANGLGLMCAIAISILANRLLYQRKRKTINVIMLIGFTIAGFLTQSRGFLVGLAFILLSFMFFMYCQHKLKTKHVLTIILIIAVFSFIYFRFFGDSAAAFMQRFKTDADDITNGRVDINGYYLEHFFDETWSSAFGYGLFAYKSYLGGESIHNATIEMIVSWGIFGFFISLAWIVMLVKSQIKPRKMIMSSVVPVCVVLLMTQSTRLFRTLVPIVYFAVALMSIRYSTNDKKQIQNSDS